MSDMMTFPDTWEEFEKSYGFTDNEEVYTNGARLIPSFRAKQWLDHLPSVKPTHQTPSNTLGALDCVDRNEAIKNLEQYKDLFSRDDGDRERYVLTRVIKELKAMPSVQPRKGKWIYGEHDVAVCDGYRCDKCGFFVPWDYQHKFIDFIKDYNYCPSCGADMRSEAREYLEYGKLIANGIAQGLRGEQDE